MGVCNFSIMFCCTLLYVHFSFAIIFKGKRGLVALLSLSSWCLVIVVWLFLAVPRVCLYFVIVVFPDHTYLLFLSKLPTVSGLLNSQIMCTYSYFSQHRPVSSVVYYINIISTRFVKNLIKNFFKIKESCSC